ncbi:DNA/RNA non-specific endonuclease [Burkholderia multivorans]|nr:DNA/RNA non-specific endonuclease [Burkholderia multivorans]
MARDLSLLTKDRNGYQQVETGREGDSGDDGGHLIATILNGAGEKLNIVPMDSNLNRGAWKQLENS